MRFSEMLQKALVRLDYSSADVYELFSDNFIGFEFFRERPFDTQWFAFSDTLSDLLKKDDIILIRNFVTDLGAGDNESQRKHFAMYTALLRERIAQAQKDIDTRSKLYRVAPLSMCLVISILMI